MIARSQEQPKKLQQPKGPPENDQWVSLKYYKKFQIPRDPKQEVKLQGQRKWGCIFGKYASPIPVLGADSALLSLLVSPIFRPSTDTYFLHKSVPQKYGTFIQSSLEYIPRLQDSNYTVPKTQEYSVTHQTSSSSLLNWQIGHGLVTNLLKYHN